MRDGMKGIKEEELENKIVIEKEGSGDGRRR
jgi:hypothetical protein